LASGLSGIQQSWKETDWSHTAVAAEWAAERMAAAVARMAAAVAAREKQDRLKVDHH